MEGPAGLSAGRGKGRDDVSCGRDGPFESDSVREVFIGATRRSSVALRLGGAEAGRVIVVGDGVGESPVIDASKSEICTPSASCAKPSPTRLSSDSQAWEATANNVAKPGLPVDFNPPRPHMLPHRVIGEMER